MKFLGFSINRCGSTYYFSGIKNILKENHNINSFYGGPYKFMYQKFQLDNETRNLLESKKRDIDKNNFPDDNYSVRLFPVHVHECGGIDVVKRFLDNDNHTTILLYRNDIEDQMLSTIMARENQIWNITDDNDRPEHNQITYSPELYYNDMVSRIKANQYLKHVIYKNIDMDYVVRYEDLIGPEIDFKNIFSDYNYSINSKFKKKLYSKEDKISRLNNYNDFKKDFEKAIQEAKGSYWWEEL